ncbi:MAG: TspO/MBR family protein [Candidatus Gastranaerophilaceae bacterium]
MSKKCLYYFFMFDNDFYKSLKLPSFVPKPVVFKYVWTILYFLMFCSLLLILFGENGNLKLYALALFLLQLFLNILWPVVFFLCENIRYALCIALVLAFTVGLCVLFFLKISVLAAFLFFPYFIWTLFAVFLNYALLRYNT